MKVIDLIIQLQKMPPNKEVILDQTNPDMDMFKFVGINTVEEIETDGEEFVLLSPMIYEEGNEDDINFNLN